MSERASLIPSLPNEVYLHPVTYEERAEIILAVKAMIDVLPEGDDMRGQARERLVSSLTKLEAHWCAWCPVEVRDLTAVAHNAVVNHGTERGRRKMGDLARTVTHYRKPLDEHFRDSRTTQARRDDCTHDGCEIRPGGTFHHGSCPKNPERKS
jgi:hypothetical protein